MTQHHRAARSAAAIILACGVTLLAACGKKEEAAPPLPSPAVQAVPPVEVPPPPAAAPAPAGPEPTAMDAEAEMRKSDCFTCHAVDKKLVGPAYSWVAFRYKDDKGAMEKLTAVVKKGGSGNWNAYTGGVPMAPHPQLSDAQIQAMVTWVLQQPPVEPPKAP